VENKGDDANAIELDKGLFKTKRCIYLAAIGIIVLLAVVYDGVFGDVC
jgi:hypothetical protein